MSINCRIAIGRRGLLGVIDVLWRFKRKTFQPPVTDPFSALDSALTTLCGANPSLPALAVFQLQVLANQDRPLSLTRPPPRARITVSRRKAIPL